MNVGKCEWFIPDAFYPEKDNGDYVSHEAVCVLNTGKTEARIDFTLYFEDRPPMGGFSAVCPAERTHHVRLDRIRSEAGGAIPRGVPYAIYVKSSVPVVVQYSRCDTTQPELAFMGLLAY
ncbi:MAG: hypothetical protein KHX22_06860 [Clostridiales bacterium]|jgi:hypothetical protein|uniref:Sensory rhodopsin transducer n=1 Tax=Candidatus Egerieisoma faecipullorum TaxID=2840963 RepID=A0A9D1L9A9_9CLOT|nr:hypothetical protein [Clostridiales bacterium]PWM20606.1 MAG: hypothetical protein DBX53_08715 [Clostridiales bacterium]HIU28671.1 hypothetical protein [Candidatus Egerieisoma faecipullorum]